MQWLRSKVQDHPLYVSLSIFAAVAAQAALTWLGQLPNMWAGTLAQEDSVTVTLFLGTAAAAAILAGFAGVVVVFGLTADGDRFRVFRLEAGKSLRGKWTSTSLAGFAAAGLSPGAAIAVVNGPDVAAPWLFELSLLLMAHGALRTVWILRELIVVVRNEDMVWSKEKGTRQVNERTFR